MAVLPDDYGEWLDTYHSLTDFQFSDLWDFDRTGLSHLPLPPEPVQTPPEMGTLIWPEGVSRCAFSHYLIDSVGLADIRTALGAGSAGPEDLVLSDGTGSSRTFSLFCLPPRPLSQITGEVQAYVLTLVDQRYWLRQRTGSITSTPDSWEDLLTDLATQLGIELDIGTIDPDYDVPTDNWVFYERPLAPVLDAACHRIGHRLIAHLDGTFETVAPAAASALQEVQIDGLTKTAGGIIERTDLARPVPESVKVVFRQHASDVPHSETEALVDLAISQYGSATGVEDQQVTLYGEPVYDAADGSGSGSSSSIVSLYATQAATDWYLWQLLDLDVTYPGITEWEPTGTEDRIEWKYFADRILTRIVRPPFQSFRQGQLRQVEEEEDSTTGNCEGDGWLTALRESDCLRAYVVGAVDEDFVTLEGNDSGYWSADDTLTICNSSFTVSFDPEDANGDPTLTLTLIDFEGSGSGSGSGGSGSTFPTFEGKVDCSGCNYIIFVFSRYTLCPCAVPNPGGPCQNLIRIRVEWAECSAGVMSCGSLTPATAQAPTVLYAQFGGELSWLGTQALTIGSAYDLDGWGAEIAAFAPPGCDYSLSGAIRFSFGTAFGLGGVLAGGAACFYQLAVSGYSLATLNYAQITGASGPDDVDDYTLTPFNWYATLGPGAALEGGGGFDPCSGYTEGGSWVRVTGTNPGSSFVVGYLTAGWYVVEGASGPVYIDDSNKCAPYTILCGPYDTEAEAAAAQADGCDCESISGWAGTGWYCVLDTGSCVPLELVDADRCDTDIIICSGPYEDEATATAACAGSGSGSGSGNGLPGTLTCCQAYESSPGVGAISANSFVVSGGIGCSMPAGSMGMTIFEEGGAYMETTVSDDGWYLFLTCFQTSGDWAAHLVGPGGNGAFGTLVDMTCTFAGITLVYDFTIFATGDPCDGVTVRYQIDLT